MARTRKSHTTDEEKAKPRSRPEPPYAKVNPYVIYCDLRRTGEEHARVLILTFAAKYAARFMLDKLIREDEFEECLPVGSRTGIITSSGIRITMFDNMLPELLAYERTEAEAEWRDDNVEKMVLQFKYGRSEYARDELPDPPAQEDSVDSPLPSKGVKPPRDPKPPKEVKPKPDTTGHVSANDIATKLKVQGREVRGVLRALNLPKPDHGWSWPKDEAAKIEKQVVEALKNGKKKK